MGTLSLPDELTGKLEALAQVDGITIEEYVRKVLDTDVLKNRKKIKGSIEDPLKNDREWVKNPLKKQLETAEVRKAFDTYMQSFAVTLQPYSAAKFRALFGRVEFAYAKITPDQPDAAVTRESLLQSSLVDVIGIPSIAAEHESAWLLPNAKDLSPLILKHTPDILPAIVAAKSCAQIIG
ncbi:hypothetical protein HZA45_00350, partial [Candidatus Peregrinibacteria bacterium]|nr:hypothetical protein [Candidatus Peregrinibacteria bacterium]